MLREHPHTASCVGCSIMRIRAAVKNLDATVTEVQLGKSKRFSRRPADAGLVPEDEASRRSLRPPHGRAVVREHAELPSRLFPLAPFALPVDTSCWADTLWTGPGDHGRGGP